MAHRAPALALGEQAYRGKVAAECLMAFGPVGGLRNEDIIAAIRIARRWTKVQTDQALVRP